MRLNYVFKLLLLGVFGLFSAQMFAQTTYNFTGSIDTYTVPPGINSIQIEANGAAGGDGSAGTGGLGAQMIGTFAVTPGQVLDIMVGEQPPGGNGGGGGTFVVDQATGTPLIVAGGGGGGAGSCCGVVHNGQPGVTTEDGTAGINASGGTGAGGIGGNGGDVGTNGQCGGAGGGFLTDGDDGFGGSTGGAAYVNGGAGGTFEGGYGGGGGSHCAANGCAGGGGGGYSGGGATGGGGQWGGGGGGGSFNSGTDQANTDGTNSGHGTVIITELCTGLTTTISADSVCDGESVTLTAESTLGGTVTWDGGVTNGEAFTPSVGTTTYTATSDDLGDCPFSVDIVVFALPTVDAGMDQDVCEGDSTMLSATGTATDWSWDGGINNGENFMPSSGTTTYTVTGTIDSTGCMATDEVDVTVIEVDETISIIPGSLVANQDGASYQWLECPDLTPVSGATGQEFTPPADGDYAVAVDLGGCMDTSACQLVHVGIEDLNGAIETTIYPNPTNDELNIAHEGTFNYTVINVIGEVILEGTANNKIQLSLKEFEAGTYTIKVTADQKTEVVKAIKY